MAKMRPQMAKIRFKMRSKMAKMKHEVDDALWYPPRHGRNRLQVGSKLRKTGITRMYVYAYMYV